MAVSQEIVNLVERFDRDRDIYQSDKYNEAQLRKEFIDPFFKALGWDMDNTKGYAPAYREVIHEDAIKVGGFTKAPDYCFRIGGARKFFLEAKKPSVNLKDDINPSFQLRRYAWSAKLPLSILTDFEEFAVYDCRIKPIKNDKSSTARTIYMKFDKYVDRWDEIAFIFAREAILKGSFDRYVESTKKKRGTAEVDAAFLKEIESWREILARNIALRNPVLTTRELNYAVQQTIDRIIFLRICEDRGIEEYGKLLSNLNGNQVYKRLIKLFRDADARYNSGLFHFEKEKDRPEDPDELTLKLNIDDKPLKAIIKDLYYPDSPYEFSVLPADILGQVYEQFLGKVIRLTAGHHAVIDDKPEVKKAGGVYYTPTYIVDYIVENTVGKLLEDKKPQQAAKLKILDPACGSGSFLIGAYQYLLDWHRNWYVDNDTKKYAKKGILYEGPGGDWRLSTTEKKRILLNNIHGVDIDSQAVEVTKLSLLLKVLEDETQLSLFKERALPDLGNNIKCGNSLIGPDFYEDQQIGMFDEEERYRINAFDWKTEFPEIMKSGGFDVVIGNPPYVRMEAFKNIKDYLRCHYASHSARSDIYTYFVEKSHLLLREGGRYGMILSNKFIKAGYGKHLRTFLAKTVNIEAIADFAGLKVFPGATVRTIVLLTRKAPLNEGAIQPTTYLAPVNTSTFESIVGGGKTVSDVVDAQAIFLPPGSLTGTRWLLVPMAHQSLLAKLEKHSVPLRYLVNDQVLWGVKTGLNEAFVIDEEVRDHILRRDPQAAEIIKPFLFGEDVRRYHICFGRRYLLYMYHGIDISRYPSVQEYLSAYRQRLQARATKQAWYELQQPSVALVSVFQTAKILYPEIAPECRFTLDTQGYFANNKTFILPIDDRYLLGILNSRISFFYFNTLCASLEGGDGRYLEFRAQYVREFPVREVGADNSDGRAIKVHIVELVNQMLELQKQLAATKTPTEKTAIQRQTNATDHQIDQLVYKLYGLTKEEIKIVEKSTRR